MLKALSFQTCLIFKFKRAVSLLFKKVLVNIELGLLFFSATLNRGHGRVTYGPSASFVGLFCLDLDFLIICTTNRALFHELM
ncbi:hypothetical protein AeNC1_019510, partial [Aphanomyces euteiches]